MNQPYRDNGLAPVFSWRQTWGDGGSDSQTKKDTKEEEWECKQAAESIVEQKHGEVSSFGKYRGTKCREVDENDPSYYQWPCWEPSPSQAAQEFQEYLHEIGLRTRSLDKRGQRGKKERGPTGAD